MGYDMKMVIFKKKTLEKLKKEISKENSEWSFSDIFSRYLFAWKYIEEYDIPKDEEAKCICSESCRIFDNFFKEEIKNDDAIIIDKDTYNNMFKWLKDKLKAISLLDLVDDKTDYKPLLRVYKGMRDANIDFDKEFIVFEHNW